MSVQRNLDKIEDMKRIKEREITIRFNADTSPRLRWKFKPHQNEIVVCYYIATAVIAMLIAF